MELNCPSSAACSSVCSIESNTWQLVLMGGGWVMSWNGLRKLWPSLVASVFYHWNSVSLSYTTKTVEKGDQYSHLMRVLYQHLDIGTWQTHGNVCAPRNNKLWEIEKRQRVIQNETSVFNLAAQKQITRAANRCVWRVAKWQTSPGSLCRVLPENYDKLKNTVSIKENNGNKHIFSSQFVVR